MMRTGSAGSTRRPQSKQGRSTSRLAELKRAVESLPLQKKSMGVLQNGKGSVRELKKGKLVLGQNSKPVMVLSRDERLNPWGKRATISEQLLNRKGLLSLFAMGVVTRQANCHELLNNRYEMAERPKIATLPTQKDLFMTNPAVLLNTYNEPSPPLPEPQAQKKNYATQQNKIKRKSSRKKIVKQAQPKFQLPEQITHLLIVNFHVEHNDAYRRCLRRAKCNGMQPYFKIYLAAFENFTVKYNLKKITIVPALNETRRLTEDQMLNAIVNHKIYGIDMKLKGDPAKMFVNLLRGKVQSLRFARMHRAVALLDRFKYYYKIKKYYQEMIAKRWRFVNFKLGSFTQNQRRLVEDNRGALARPEVEIHILASDLGVGQLQSYYKWGERKKIQLTRLYNNECSHLILILNRREQISKWVEQIENCPSNWKKPVVHVFFSSLGQGIEGVGLDEQADVYFGLLPATIASIKQICWERTAVVVPSRIGNYLPKLCEALGANLFAGSFTESSKLSLFAEQEQVESQLRDSSAKFKKIQSGGKQVNEFYRRRFGRIRLRGELLQSKEMVKGLFLQWGLPTPLSLSMGLSYEDFLRDLSRCILVNKRFNRWILKLPDSTFSRGLAVLETESLKIIKEAKKRAGVREEDVDQISKIMDSVLVQKISIPHSSLLNGEEFMTLFKRGGYIEGYLDNCATLCVFGRIQLNGSFSLLGTCRKYYAQGICFGALYPATDVRASMLSQIKQACRYLYLSSMFGYITFELLLDQKTKEFYFIDLVPHLQEYSSLYFYYRRVLGMGEGETGLQRRVFYCPFIDNNGNRCGSVEQFNELRSERKVLFDGDGLQGTQFFFLNEGVPDVLSMVCFGRDEGSVVRQCLEGLSFLVEIGGEFNKFDKKFKSRQSDGLYIMDIIWKLRQLKKEYSDK